MNRAAKALAARDPLISSNAVRFLLMAGTSASTFFAGFRQREDGETLSLWQTAPRSLVARQATVHNGAGRFFSDAARRKIKLSYRTHRYSYSEDSLGSTGEAMRTAVADVADHVRSFDRVASRFDESVTARLDEMKAMPADMTERSIELLQGMATTIQLKLEAIVQAQQQFADEIARSAQASVAVLDGHNTAMEQELNRSRENVSKVHGALVEMTGSLVERVQTAAS